MYVLRTNQDLDNHIHKIPKHNKVYYLDDIDFMGDDRTHDMIIKMWNGGCTIHEIANFLNESTDKTFIILWHLSRTFQIKPRKNGLWGR